MRNPRHRGVTLVEVMVVIALIGLLVGLLLPAVQGARESAGRTACLNNMRQIGLAVRNFEELHKQLPVSNAKPKVKNAKSLLSWMALMLPQMGQESLYQSSVLACELEKDPRKNPPHIGMGTVVPSYVCGSDGRLLRPLTDKDGVRAGFTSYIGIMGTLPPGANKGLLGTIGFHGSTRLNQVRDGLSQTLLAGERPPPDSLQAGWWYPSYNWYRKPSRGPNNGIILGNTGRHGDDDACQITKGTFGPGRLSNPCDRFHLWSLHPGGANFLFADGSARFLAYSAEPVVMAMASRDGGEAVNLPD